MKHRFPGKQLHFFSVLVIFILFLIVLVWMNKLTLGDFLKRLMQ
jgi:hypothetical protein